MDRISPPRRRPRRRLLPVLLLIAAVLVVGRQHPAGAGGRSPRGAGIYQRRI